MIKPELKNISLSGVALVIVIGSPSSEAHTTFRQPPSPAFIATDAAKTPVFPTGVYENKKDYDFVQTSHGCFTDSSFQKLNRVPVVGTSVVFPTDPDSIVETFPSSAKTPSGYGNPFATDGSQNIKGTQSSLDANFKWTDHTGAVASLASISNLLTTMPSTAVFPKWVRKTDPLGNPVGFATYGGKLDPFSTGAYPFALGGVSFAPTSCAQKLVIRVAIADICKRNAFPPGAHEGEANVWINHPTAKFSHPNIDGIAPLAQPDATSPAVPTAAKFWPTITITRDTKSNPLPASCNGNGLDVFVTPTDAQIDRDLPIPGFWGK